MIVIIMGVIWIATLIIVIKYYKNRENDLINKFKIAMINKQFLMCPGIDSGHCPVYTHLTGGDVLNENISDWYSRDIYSKLGFSHTRGNENPVEDNGYYPVP